MPDNLTPEQRAFKRGLEEGELKAKVASHDDHFDELNGHVKRTESKVDKLHECVEEILAAQEVRVKIEKDRVIVEAARVAVEEKRAKEQVSKWNLYAVGVALLISFAGLLAGAGVLG